MADKFSKFPTVLDSPAESAFPITPTNTTELAIATRYLYVATGGTINVIFVNDTANTSLTVATGAILPFRLKVVHATGTTATGLIGLV